MSEKYKFIPKQEKYRKVRELLNILKITKI